MRVVVGNEVAEKGEWTYVVLSGEVSVCLFADGSWGPAEEFGAETTKAPPSQREGGALGV